MTAQNDRSETLFVASTDEIRAAFPALERQHGGFPVAYFDGPGGTQVPRAVAEAMTDYLFHHNANTHWAFPTSAETDAALADARRVFADFMNASPDEIVFGPNMTSLTYRVSRALGRRLGHGDAIVVTELDHHANIDPWRALERARGVTIRQARMIPETGQLDWDDLDRCLNQHGTKVLAIGAASNALGTINDIPRAVAMAHEAEAIAFVNAVHFAPHQLVDVQAAGCDFLACSAYKFYGPHVGILYGKRDLLRSLEVTRLRPAPDTAPERWEAGTQNHEGIVGAAAAVRFLANLAGDQVSALTKPASAASGWRPCSTCCTNEAPHSANSSGRAWVPSTAFASWTTPVGASDADGFVDCPRNPSGRGLHWPCTPGHLRVARQLLRPDRCRPPRSIRRRPGAPGVCLLHDRRRGQASHRDRSRHRREQR